MRRHWPGFLLGPACLILALAPALAAPVVAVRAWLPGFEAYRDVIVRDFQREYPEIRLDLSCVPAADYADKLMAAAALKQAPDVCLMDYGLLGSLADAKLLEPFDAYLNDLRDLGSIHPLFLRQLVLDGKIVGLPATGHPPALFIRRDWLEKLKLAAPTSWEEFTATAEAFTKRDPDGDGKADTYGLAERWPATDPVVAARFLTWLYQAGGTAVVRLNGVWSPTFGNNAGLKAVYMLRRLWEAGYIAPGAPANDAAKTLAAFTSGQAGMLIEDDRAVPAIRRALGDKAVCVPLPRDIRRCAVGEGLGFALFKQGNYKGAALTFIQWWLTRETQEKLILGWDGKLGGAGADQGALVLTPRFDLDPAAILHEPLYTGFVQSFPNLSPEPYCPNYANLKLIIAKSVAEAMGPGKTVEEAMGAGMKEAVALFAQ